jgi:hypothetical protein
VKRALLPDVPPDADPVDLAGARDLLWALGDGFAAFFATGFFAALLAVFAMV